MSIVITKRDLKGLGACQTWLDLYSQDFPNGLELKPENWAYLLRKGYGPILSWLYQATDLEIYRPNFTGQVIEDVSITGVSTIDWIANGAIFKDCFFYDCTIENMANCTFNNCGFEKTYVGNLGADVRLLECTFYE